MKLGFDAKRLFHNRTGLGNYSRNLVEIISDYYPNNEYILFNNKDKNNISFESQNNMKIETPKGILKKLHFLWRSYFVTKETSFNQIDIFHGLSGEIPFGISPHIKKIVTIHDLIFVRYPELYSYWDKETHIWKHKYAAKKADVVVAVSQQTKNDLIEYFKIPEDKIKVVYQGCSNLFKKEIEEKELNLVKEKYNLPDQFILNVGTIEERKNVLTLVKVIKDLDIPLIIIGKKTKYTDKVIEYIEENNLQNRVIILQNILIEELVVFYQLATVFVYPSVFEGFGIPIIEALYSGTPVITNKEGVFHESGGPSSCYVDVTNVDELINALQYLLENPDVRNKMVIEGKEFVKKFDNENIALEWNEVYSKCLLNK